MMFLLRDDAKWDSIKEGYNFKWLFEIIDQEAGLISNANNCALNIFLSGKTCLGDY